MTDEEFERAARAAADLHGNECATPVIRSMYPSRSRGQMKNEFMSSFLSGCEWARAEGQAHLCAVNPDFGKYSIGVDFFNSSMAAIEAMAEENNNGE